MNRILVVDFEAICCNDEEFPREETEIIEIGAVIAQKKSGQIISTFNSFVKPLLHTNLTDFCKDLTSITQLDIDKAEPLEKVLAKMEHWLNDYNLQQWGSWGGYDERQLKQECEKKNIHNPLLNIGHLNLKKLFAMHENLKHQIGLGQALHFKNMKFVGTAHRGIDDAKNIARLLPIIFNQ